MKSSKTYYLRFSTFFAWFYAIFDVKIALKRQFCFSGLLWSTRRVDHMCVISPNEVWGLVSIYLKSLPPKYHVKKSKTHHGGSKNKNHFFLFASTGRWWNNHLHFSLSSFHKKFYLSTSTSNITHCCILSNICTLILLVRILFMNWLWRSVLINIGWVREFEVWF